MLHTQFYSPTGAALGTLASSVAITDLQRYLASIGKINSSDITGVMNDHTMGAIVLTLIGSADTVSKIPLLPADVRGTIQSIVSDLKSADSTIRDKTFNIASLSTMVSNWTNVQSLVRVGVNAISSGKGDAAADAMNTVREQIYNKVGAAAGALKAAFAVLYQGGAGNWRLQQALHAMQNNAQLVAVPGAGSGVTIYAWSPKRNMFRVAVPNPGGLGWSVVDGAAAFTEVAPTAAAPSTATQITETEFDAKTGQLPFYKKPWFWLTVAGGVVAVGGGYVIYRRKKRSA